MSTGESPPTALRLTFTYDGDSVRLASGRIVEMIADVTVTTSAGTSAVGPASQFTYM